MFKEIIQKAKREFDIREDFVRVGKGTRADVFYSDSYILKIQKNGLLKNEEYVLNIAKGPKTP